MAESLTDTNVAVFLAQRGTEEVEFTEPKGAVEDAGASTDVVGAETGEVQTVNNDLDPGDTFEVEKTFSEVSPTITMRSSFRVAPSERTNSARTATQWISSGSSSRQKSPQESSATALGRWSRPTWSRVGR